MARRKAARTVQVRTYRVCKKRKCTAKKRGRKVQCSETYQFKPVGKPRRIRSTEVKLLLLRAAPVLTFMTAESCAHGIFPSQMGTETMHILTDLSEKIRPRLARKKKAVTGAPIRLPRRRFLFDTEEFGDGSDYGADEIFDGVLRPI